MTAWRIPGVVHNEDPVNSADQEDDVDDVARVPEIISVDGSEGAR